MLKFFRRIRYTLLENNNTGKYLKYAVGEIVLVVIGILIALQINNWNENRKDRVREQKLLSQLADEFRANLDQIDNKIRLRENIIRQSADVLGYIDSGAAVPVDTLLKKISVILLGPTFDPTKFGDLNADNIQLIRNDSLKSYLSNWSSRITNLKEQENEWVNLINNYTIPLLIDLGISRDVNISFYEDSKNLDYLLDKSKSSSLSIKKSNSPPTTSEILSNKKLEGILANAVLMNEGVNWESVAYRNRILRILELIESEIKE